MKFAVFSMDLEDWHHLDYFRGMNCDRSRSLFDGVEVYREILDRHKIPSSFYVLGEMIEPWRGLLAELASQGHDVGSHGWDHRRPLTLTLQEFDQDLRRSKAALEEALGQPVPGYRAPCFSLDDERLDRVRAAGFLYDTSRMPFEQHPLYGKIGLQGFEEVASCIYRHGDFFEFELSVLALAGRKIPVSGGGYIRMFPWMLTRGLIRRYIRGHDLYLLYIHPFELSRRPLPPLPDGVGKTVRLRFGLGRSSVPRKLGELIALLKSNGFRFTTLARLRHEILTADTGRPPDA